MTKLGIEAFLAAVQYGSLSAAAEQLYITQPALSRRIQNLETELEYTLIRREKGIRGISLTEQGKAFLSVAQKWNSIYQEARAIKNIKQKPLLHLASVGSVVTYILPDVFKKCSSEEALFNLDYHYCHSWEGYTLVESGFADIALIDYLNLSSNHSQGILSIPVFSVPFVLIGGADYKAKKVLHPSELDPGNEILLPWNSSFEMWHSYWFNASVTPRVKLDHATVIKDVLQDNLYAIVPRMLANQLLKENQAFTLCELTDGPTDEIIHCLVSESCYHKPHVQHFFSLLKEHLQTRNDIYCLLE